MGFQNSAEHNKHSIKTSYSFHNLLLNIQCFHAFKATFNFFIFPCLWNLEKPNSLNQKIMLSILEDSDTVLAILWLLLMVFYHFNLGDFVAKTKILKSINRYCDSLEKWCRYLNSKDYYPVCVFCFFVGGEWGDALRVKDLRTSWHSYPQGILGNNRQSRGEEIVL